MRKEESIAITKFEYSRTNSAGNRLGLEIRFQQNATFVEDLELYAQMLAEASAELGKELTKNYDRPRIKTGVH